MTGYRKSEGAGGGGPAPLYLFYPPSYDTDCLNTMPIYTETVSLSGGTATVRLFQIYDFNLDYIASSYTHSQTSGYLVETADGINFRTVDVKTPYSQPFSWGVQAYSDIFFDPDYDADKIKDLLTEYTPTLNLNTTAEIGKTDRVKFPSKYTGGKAARAGGCYYSTPKHNLTYLQDIFETMVLNQGGTAYLDGQETTCTLTTATAQTVMDGLYILSSLIYRPGISNNVSQAALDCYRTYTSTGGMSYFTPTATINKRTYKIMITLKGGFRSGFVSSTGTNVYTVPFGYADTVGEDFGFYMQKGSIAYLSKVETITVPYN